MPDDATITKADRPDGHTPRPIGLARFVMVALGLLLIAAAALKGYQALSSTAPDHNLILVAALAEWVLGLWLISGLRRRLAQLTALIIVAVFAGVTLHQALSGLESCGCFGPIKINPWYTFALDCSLFVLLLASIRAPRPKTEPQHSTAWLIGTCLVALAVPTGIGVGLMTFGDVVGRPSQTGSADTEVITVGTTADSSSDQSPEPQLIADFGYVVPDKTYRKFFTVVNPSDTAMVIKHTDFQCACSTLPHMPKTIPARGFVTFPVDLVPPQLTEHYVKTITLHTDHPDSPSITLTIRADINLPLVASPSTVALVSVAPDGEGHGEITLLNRGDQPVRLLYATSNSPAWSAPVPRQATLEPHGKLTLPLHVRLPAGPAAAKATTPAQITFHTSLASQPVLRINATCQ